MNNSTNITHWWHAYSSQDLELVNLIQSACSLIATLIIMVKLFEPSIIFRRIKEKRQQARQNKKRREMERLKSLVESIQSGKVVDITSLLSDDEDDDEEKSDGVMKIARKKKSDNSTRV